MVNLQRIRKEGLSGKGYIFFWDNGVQYVIPNKYGKVWWKRAKVSDIRRVAVR